MMIWWNDHDLDVLPSDLQSLWLHKFNILTKYPPPTWLHLRCDVGLDSGGRGILRKLFLCYSIVYYYNGARRYEQFLQVSQLYRALISLGLAPCLPSTSVSLSFMVLCRYFNFLLHSFIYLVVSWDWWDWPLTWLTNHCPSVLWHCWLSHLTRRIVSEMTYNVSSWTLNPTIPCCVTTSEVCVAVCDGSVTDDNNTFWCKTNDEHVESCFC